MLQRIIEYLHSSSAPIDANKLARELDVDRSALEGMLETLIQQKRIMLEEDICCNCEFNNVNCGQQTACPFVGKTYKRYTIPK